MLIKPISTNKTAYRNYALSDNFEAGVILSGGEVKSIRELKADITDSFARIDGGEMFLYNMHIAPYEYAASMKVDPKRPRKLLLHKKEITRLIGKISQKGFTIVPTKLYFNSKGFVKLELALAKGKKLFDKREDIKKRELKREMRRFAASR